MKIVPKSLVALPLALAAGLGLACLVGASPGWTQDDKELRKVTSPVGVPARVALVIANAAYPEAPLPNTLNDADDMASALKQLGFVVTVGKDWNRKQIEQALQKFGRDSKGSQIALFYFSGHGVQHEGHNYLVPCAHSIEKEADIPFEAVDAQRVLVEMQEAGSGCNLLILDACRNRPRAAGDGKALFAEKGLAPMKGPVGTYIAYATAPGDTASVNVAGRNSLYTQELLKNLRTPDLRVEEVFKRTRVRVRSLSGGKQTPWEESSLENDVVLLTKPEPNGEVKELDTHARLSIAVVPAQAVVLVDGKKATGNDFSLNLIDEKTKTVEVKVTAPGYQSKLMEVTLTRGETRSLPVKLVASAAPTPVAPPKPVGNVTTTARLASQTLLAFVPGILKDANEAVNSYDHPLYKAYALYDIGSAQALSGDTVGAKQTLARLQRCAQQMPDHWYQADLLSQVAQLQSMTDDPQGARQTLIRAKQIAQMAQQEAEAKDKAVGSPFCAVADAQEKTGDRQGAKETSKLIPMYEQSSTLSAIASTQAEAGRIEEAKQTAQYIKREIDKYSAFCTIAVSQARSGNVLESLQTIQNIKDNGLKLKALSSVCCVQAAALDMVGAKQTLQRVVDSAREESGEVGEITALASVASAQAATGDVEAARETLRRAKAAASSRLLSPKLDALTGIARICAEKARLLTQAPQP